MDPFGPASEVTRTWSPRIRKPSSFFVSIGALGLLVMVGLAGMSWWRMQSVVSVSESEVTGQTDVVPEVLSAVTEAPVEEPKVSDAEIKTEYVSWLFEPKRIDSLGVMAMVDSISPYAYEYCESPTSCASMQKQTATYETNAEYYEVGEMIRKYPEATVYLAIVTGLPALLSADEVSDARDVVFSEDRIVLFIRMPDGGYIFTDDYDNEKVLCGGNCTTGQMTDTEGLKWEGSLVLDAAGSGSKIADSSTGTRLPLELKPRMFKDAGWKHVRNLQLGYDLYAHHQPKDAHVSLQYLLSPQAVVRLPSGLVAEVADTYWNETLLITANGASDSDTRVLAWMSGDLPPLLPKEPLDKGTLTDYSKLEYTYDYDGCRGGLKLEKMAENTEVLSLGEGIVQVGQAAGGSALYRLTVPHLTMFREFWFQTVALNGLQDSLSYDAYIRLDPILLFKDALGLYRTVFRSDLVSSKCMPQSVHSGSITSN